MLARNDGIQKVIHDGRAGLNLKKLEAKLQSELATILHQEELIWFQRSRARWLTDGDRNTNYYHLKLINRRRQNRVLMLRDMSGNWVEEASNIRTMVNDYYHHLFNCEGNILEWYQTRYTFPHIDNTISQQLGEPLTDEEIKK